MDEIRVRRIESMMKDELSVLINRSMKDPRIPSVSVTQVELTRDAKQATVYISLISINATAGDPELMASCLGALTQAKGYLRKQISSIMKLRYMPDMIFKEDKGLENTLRVHELLKQIGKEKKPEDSTSAAPSAAVSAAPVNQASASLAKPSDK
jgi:ribosome-binding factor A